jgi:hypothetical protein
MIAQLSVTILLILGIVVIPFLIGYKINLIPNPNLGDRWLSGFAVLLCGIVLSLIISLLWGVAGNIVG